MCYICNAVQRSTVITDKNMATAPTPALENAAQAIAEGIKPIVDEIHSKQPTGKNYYSDYMLLISQMKEARPTVPVSFWGIVLLKAGCNVNGVESAIKLS